ELAIDRRPRAELADPPDDANYLGLEDQLIARNNLALEPRAIDSRKIDERFAARFCVARVESEQRGQLRQRLDDEDAGHQWKSGEMSLEERLVERDILQAANRYAGIAGKHAVHQQERIAMGKLFEDLPDVERLHERSSPWTFSCPIGHRHRPSFFALVPARDRLSRAGVLLAT